MQPMASMALRAARSAAQHIMHGFDRPHLIKASEKAHNDPVTNLDRDSEKIIIEELSALYPDHGFIGEEETSEISNPDAEYQWIIDPIDGTYNFMRNIPHFCISIGCMKNGRLEHGVIVDPVRNEEFVASRGGEGTACCQPASITAFVRSSAILRPSLSIGRSAQPSTTWRHRK